jgi:two-component sensor histidine kinase
MVIAACHTTPSASDGGDKPTVTELQAVIERLRAVLHGRDVPPAPPESAAVPGLAELHHDLVELRSVISAMAQGELATAITRRNYVSSSLKTLQANLYHLTWQAQMVAAGDFSQRVDFLGDFSAAFNTMVEQLAASFQTLKTRECDLETALEQKRLLLKEVNHRVKNNLSVVASLLHLQTSLVKDPRDAELFVEAEARVKVMAKIHELLYRSVTLDMVPAGEFFTAIAHQLIRSYARRDIVLQVECGDLALGLDTVIPCGLIINELVTNALKYAFPEGKSGMISIRLASETSECLVLTMRDNGIGLPAGLDIEQADSLGLTLVTSLSTQLGGTLHLEQVGGTSFTFRFPVP